MNMWVVLCQAITFAVLLAQYQLFNEVDAEEPRTLTPGGWFGDLEKKLNVIKGVLHDVFQSIKQSAQKLPLPVTPQRRQIINDQEVPTTAITLYEDRTINKKTDDVIISPSEDLFPKLDADCSKRKDTLAMENVDEYASGLTQENSAQYEHYNNKPQAHQKKKKKSKKPKKKIKPKRKSKPKKVHMEKAPVHKVHITKAPVENEHVQPEFDMRARKSNMHKRKPVKFIKTFVDKVNESESEENGRKGKPVDIIVHIKMNE